MSSQRRTILNKKTCQSIISTVKNVMWKGCLGFYVCPKCGDDIFVIGYDESTVMHKKRKFTYEYVQPKIGKLLCREPLQIPDRVMRLLEGELHNSDNILYCYSQVDSLTIPILEQLLKKKNS